MVFYFTESYWVETKLVVKSPSYDKGRNDAIKDKCWPFDAGVLNSIGDISVNSSNLRYISPCIHSTCTHLKENSFMNLQNLNFSPLTPPCIFFPPLDSYVFHAS